LTPTLGPYLLHRTSRHRVGGESCCPSLSHMDLTHTHTYHHNTTSLSLSSFRTTSVHRSSTYGKDYITSHFAAHKERRLYDIKGSRDTKDGRTDAMALFHLAFKRSRFTDCIPSDSDRRERRNKSLAYCATFELCLFFASNTPYALHQRYLILSYGSGRFGIERGRLLRKSALWRYKVRLHSFRLIRLYVQSFIRTNQTFKATSFAAL